MNGSNLSHAIGPNCGKCKFFVDTGEKKTELGECHRYPPRVDSMLVGLKEDGEPIIHRIVTPGLTPVHGWCGEYVQKLVIPAAG